MRELVAGFVVQLVEACRTHPFAASMIRVRAHRHAFRVGAMSNARSRLGGAVPVLAGPACMRDSADVQADIATALGFHGAHYNCMDIQYIAG